MKNILVVDDDAINRKLLTAVLKNKGYNIIEANNGVEALSAIESNNIDLILLDVLMPVMNGIEFLQNIKAKPQYMNIPIIVLTTDDTKKSEVINLGANDFITKPINPTLLLEKLSEF